MLQVMFHWAPVKRFLHWCGARTPHTNQKHDATLFGGCFLNSHIRRVAFPMGAYGAKTMKYTVFLSFPIVKGLRYLHFQNQTNLGYGEPNMGHLRRALSMDVLKQALRRTGCFTSWAQGLLKQQFSSVPYV